MSPRFEPIIAVTGWTTPPTGQIGLKLPSPGPSIRNLAGFGIRLLPSLRRLHQLVRDAVAVNVHYPGLEILPLILLKKLGLCPKLIISVHGSDVMEMLQSSGTARRFYRFMLSSADVVIACSKALANSVLRISPPAHVVSILNATSSPPPPIGKRPLDPRYLLCVGKFEKRKGQDILLQAYRQICDKQCDLRLVLIGGDGPDRAFVTKLVHDLDLDSRVDMLVNVPQEQVWEWIRHAECLILPSRREPFGICLLEAGLVHTPVVASRVGGIPEFVEHGGHGLLCDPEQVGCFADAILKTLSDPVSAKARADAFYRQVSGMTWDRVFESYREAAALP